MDQSPNQGLKTLEELSNELEQMEKAFDEAISQVRKTLETEALEEVRVRFLGKKGALTGFMKQMSQVSKEDKPKLGQKANVVREKMKTALDDLQAKIQEKLLEAKLLTEVVDVTYPGTKPELGALHPLERVTRQICDLFIGLGYTIAEGPELELTSYNFDKLRIGESHPSRDVKDTFYIDEKRLLRTQTSAIQIRVMENQNPPIRILCPGKVYRRDTPDATHSPIFTQMEGLVVDEGVSMANLKGTLEMFARSLFGATSRIRLRPHFFPFTEPSCEVDVSCWTCNGLDPHCPTCKGEGWVEILGAGMVHPEVLQNCGIDSKKYQGFAFGIGIERAAMGRWGIKSIRPFYDNDIRFLKQFKEEF